MFPLVPHRISGAYGMGVTGICDDDNATDHGYRNNDNNNDNNNDDNSINYRHCENIKLKNTGRGRIFNR